MNIKTTSIALPLVLTLAACAGQEELTPAAQQERELACQDLQLESLYAETDEERGIAQDKIDALKCNKAVTSAEKRRRDADHNRSMRSRAGQSPGADISSRQPEF